MSRTRQDHSVHHAAKRDLWPAEREGYTPIPRAAYPAIRQAVQEPRRTFPIRAEKQLSAAITCVGLAWTTQIVTNNFATLPELSLFSVEPLEVCAIGSLVWLHAKWRNVVQRG